MEIIADWFLGVLLLHEDIEKLTRPLDHKQVFVNFNVFYFPFNCATVDFYIGIAKFIVK